MDNKSWVSSIMNEARKHAETNAIQIGAIVAHPAHHETFKLISVNGGVATVGIKPEPHDAIMETMELPFCELVDAILCIAIAHRKRSEELLQKAVHWHIMMTAETPMTVH